MKLKFGNRTTSSHSVALRALTVCAFLLFGTAAAHCDPVLDWNVIALQTTAAAPFNPPLESRSLAIVHAAIFFEAVGLRQDVIDHAFINRLFKRSFYNQRLPYF